MKKTRKLGIKLLVLAGCISLMTGCGDAQKLQGTTDIASSSQETALASGETKAEGQAQTEGQSTLISDEPFELSIMMMDNPNQPLRQDTPSHEEIFKKTNVKLNLQIVPSAGYNEKKSIVLGTNNFPDLIYIPTTADIVTYGESGVFEPLMQYVNEETMPNFYRFWQQYPEMKKYLLNDELYVFPVIAREETANGFGPVIRQDLLEKNNLKRPESFDELLAVLAKLKEIYPDSIPWTGRKGTSQLLKTTSYMLGSGYGSNGLYYDHDEERYIFGPASEKFKAVLKYLNKAYTIGVLDPEFATTTAEQMESKLTSGKSFFYLDNSGFSSNYTGVMRKMPGLEEALFQVLPIPENSFGQRRAESYAKELPGRFYALNASSKNKEKIIKFIDWLYSKEGSDITNYGVEGYSFVYNSQGEPEFKKDYVMKFKDAKPSDYYAIYADLGITKLDVCMWACNTKTWFEIQKLDGNWTQDNDEYWSIIQNDKAYVQPHIDPPLTSDESAKVQDILADLSTMLEQEYNNYIMGVNALEDWDKVIKKCEDMGVRELEKIYNDAEARSRQQ